ncbi:MAG: hypothetical protein IB616_04370 [Methanosarcinales archaeon]|nr:MAG: hypothetical protein IB616_04370 [Methanosarcinales archaeon]
MVGKAITGAGNITQSFEVTSTDTNAADLSWKWRKYSTLSEVSAINTIYVQLIDPGAKVVYVWSDDTLPDLTTTAWVPVSTDVSSYLTATGTWQVKLLWDITTGRTNGAEMGADFDDVYMNITYAVVAPNITSFGPTYDPTDVEGATRTFNVTVDQTVYVSWQINGSEVQTNTSVTEASYTNTSAAMGYWNVSAIVTNANGADMQTWWWTVTDGTAPVIGSDPAINDTLLALGEVARLNITVDDNVGVHIVYFNISGTNYTHTGIMENVYYYDWVCKSSGTYSWDTTYANDSANNWNSSTAELPKTFECDAVLPTAFSLSSPANNTVSTSGTPTLNWDDTVETNFKNYTVQVDNDPVFGSVDYTYETTGEVTNSSYTVTSPWATDFTWYWGVIAYDQAGNSRQSTETFVYITDTTPLASITNLQNTTGNFWINWTWTNPPTDFNHTMVYINGAWTVNTSDPFYNGTYSAHATKEIATRTVDAAGNINTSWVNQTTTIPNNPPVLDTIDDKSIDENQQLMIDANATDLDTDTLTYSCNRTDLFTDFDTSTGKGNWTPTYADTGIYYVDFGVSDGYDGTDNETVTITVNNIPLVIDSYWNNITGASLTLTVNESEAVEFGVTTNRTVNNISWYEDDVFQENDSLTSQGNYTTSWSVNGSYTVNVTASDDYDTTANTTFTITVNDITPPAQVTGLINDTPTTSTVNLTWNANSETDLVGYHVYQDGSWLGDTANTYYNVTGLDASTIYEFNVSAYDDNNLKGPNATVYVTTATPLNTPPEEIADVYSLEQDAGWGETFGFDCQVNDTEGDDVTVRLEISNNSGATWREYQSYYTVTTLPGWANFTVDYNEGLGGVDLWTSTDVDVQLQYRFVLNDTYSSSTGTAHVVAENLTKDDTTLSYSQGDGGVVNRAGTETITLEARLYDTDRDAYPEGETITFEIDANATAVNDTKTAATNATGYATLLLDPDDTYDVGVRAWNASIINNASYKTNSTGYYSFTVNGTINNTNFGEAGTYSIGPNPININITIDSDDEGEESTYGLVGCNVTLYVYDDGGTLRVDGATMTDENNGNYTHAISNTAGWASGYLRIQINSSKPYYNGDDDWYNTSILLAIYDVIITDPADQTTPVNVNATYEIAIKNNGTMEDTFDLAVENTNNAAIAALNQSTITLAAEATGNVTLNVTDETAGTYSVNVTATSQGDSTKTDKITVITTVEFYDVIITDPADQTTALGVNATYEIAIKNNGTVEDTFDLSLVNTSSADVAALNQSAITLASGATGNVTLNVTDNDATGIYNVDVTTTSRVDPSATDTITIATNVTSPKLTLGNVSDVSADWGRDIDLRHNVTVSDVDATNPVYMNYSVSWINNESWPSGIGKDVTEWNNQTINRPLPNETLVTVNVNSSNAVNASAQFWVNITKRDTVPSIENTSSISSMPPVTFWVNATVRDEHGEDYVGNVTLLRNESAYDEMSAVNGAVNFSVTQSDVATYEYALITDKNTTYYNADVTTVNRTVTTYQPTPVLGNAVDLESDWGRNFWVNHSVSVSGGDMTNPVNINYSVSWLDNETWDSIAEGATVWHNQSESRPDPGPNDVIINVTGNGATNDTDNHIWVNITKRTPTSNMDSPSTQVVAADETFYINATVIDEWADDYVGSADLLKELSVVDTLSVTNNAVNFTYSETSGTYNFSVRFYNTTHHFNTTTTNSTVTVDIASPEWYDQGQDVNSLHKGESITVSTRWTDNINLKNATLSANATVGWEDIETIYLGGTDKWSNFTLTTQLLNWTPGIKGWNITANDTAGNENTTDVKTFELWGWSNVSWTSPTGGSTYSPGDIVELKCQVRDANSSAVIENYPVKFWWYNSTMTQDLGENTTDVNGYTTLNWDTSDLAEGIYYPKANITDNATLFYNISADWECNTSVTLSDTTPPKWYDQGQDVDSLHKGEKINVSARWTDNLELKNATLSHNGSDDWVNVSTIALSGTEDWSNFTVTAALDWTPGVKGWKIYANDTSDCENATDVMTFEVWGYSNVSWTSPPDDSTRTVGDTIELVAHVRDANSSLAIDGHPVKFYNVSGVVATYLGQNTTNASGYAVWYWDTTGLSAGTYYPKANITDNASLYYNASADYECNISLTLAVYEVIITDPADQTTALGVNATYEIAIKNNGTVEDMFDLSLVNTSSADVAALNKTTITIGAGATGYVTLNVTDNDATEIYNVNVTATSQTNPSATDTVTIATTVTRPTLILGNISDVSADWGRDIDLRHNVTVSGADASNPVCMNYSVDWIANASWPSISIVETKWNNQTVSRSSPDETLVTVNANSSNAVNASTSFWVNITKRDLVAEMLSPATQGKSTGVTFWINTSCVDEHDVDFTGDADLTENGIVIDTKAGITRYANFSLSKSAEGTYNYTVTFYNTTYYVNDTTGYSNVTVRFYDVIVTAPPNQNTIVNVNATYEIAIKNNGTAGDTFNLTVENIDNVAVVALNQSTITLAAGVSGNVTLNVTDESGGVYNVSVTATSQGYSGATDTITITTTIPVIINVTVEYTPIKFGNVNHSTINHPADTQNGFPMNITIEPDTNVHVDIFFKGDNFANNSYNFSVGNLTMDETPEIGIEPFTFSTSYPETGVFTNVPPGTTKSCYFWLSTPFGQYPGSYGNNVSIRVNETVGG